MGGAGAHLHVPLSADVTFAHLRGSSRGSHVSPHRSYQRVSFVLFHAKGSSQSCFVGWSLGQVVCAYESAR